jgi:hypothetical protein
MAPDTFRSAHDLVGLRTRLLGHPQITPQINSAFSATNDSVGAMTDDIGARPAASGRSDPRGSQNSARLVQTVITEDSVLSDEHRPCSNDLHLQPTAGRSPWSRNSMNDDFALADGAPPAAVASRTFRLRSNRNKRIAHAPCTNPDSFRSVSLELISVACSQRPCGLTVTVRATVNCQEHVVRLTTFEVDRTMPPAANRGRQCHRSCNRNALNRLMLTRLWISTSGQRLAADYAITCEASQPTAVHQPTGCSGNSMPWLKMSERCETVPSAVTCRRPQPTASSPHYRRSAGLLTPRAPRFNTCV